MKRDYEENTINNKYGELIFEYTEEIPIKIMDGSLDYDNISEDLICIVNIGIDEILKWIEKNKRKTYINYRGKEYVGKDSYPSVFIFEDRKILDKFIKSIKISEHSLEDFILHDIKYELSSSLDRIRIIKRYNLDHKLDRIKGMCEFIDIESFKNGKTDDILEDRLLIKINDIDYKYREIFYCIEC